MTREDTTTPGTLSKNVTVFSAICALFLIATVIGVLRNPSAVSHRQSRKESISVPSVGRIQVLNGFGAEDAAQKVAGFLRTRTYDVKNIGNAASWNYPFTLVVSRGRDMTVARQVAASLTTGHLVMVRTDDRTYDVTVIVGPDYKERIR